MMKLRQQVTGICLAGGQFAKASASESPISPDSPLSAAKNTAQHFAACSSACHKEEAVLMNFHFVQEMQAHPRRRPCSPGPAGGAHLGCPAGAGLLPRAEGVPAHRAAARLRVRHHDVALGVDDICCRVVRHGHCARCRTQCQRLRVGLPSGLSLE